MALLMTGAAIIFLFSKCIFFTSKDVDKSNKNFLIFVFIVLVFILGTRNGQVNYGNDLNNYYRTFERAITLSKEEFFSTSSMEMGYLWINWILARVIKWPQFIIIFQAIFCCGITLRFIYKHTDDVLMSVLGFMSFGILQFYMTGFRQSMAISICLIALEMAERKKWIFFAVLLIIAITMHQTALVCLAMPLLIRNRLTRLSLIMDIILVLILSQIVPRIIELGNIIFEKEYSAAYAGNALGGTVNILIGVSVVGIIFLQSYKADKVSENKKIEKKSGIRLENWNYNLMHLLIVGTGIYALRYQALVLERISMYFTPSLFIVFPEIINKEFTMESKRFLKACSVFAMIFLIYWRMSGIDYVPFWK